MSPGTPTLLVVGSRSHGAAEYAFDLAERVRAAASDTDVVTAADGAEAERAARLFPRLHLHVTDGLFGSTLEEAAQRLERIAASTALTLTLHDLPQESDGARNLPRRSEAYARMVAGSRGVLVSSRHEAALFAEHVAPVVEGGVSAPAVIPLGTVRALAPERRSRDPHPDHPLEILLAGFVYPGKGHAEAIRAAAALRTRAGLPSVIRVTALGGVSPGHDADAHELIGEASRSGVEFRVTGRLSDEEYRRRIREGGIPLVAHRHYSASRSLLDWGEQGRRPLVGDTRYTREMAALRPGTLTLVPVDDPAALAEVLEAAWRDPRLTELDAATSLAPTLDDAASAHLAWWRSLAW